MAQVSVHQARGTHGTRYVDVLSSSCPVPCCVCLCMCMCFCVSVCIRWYACTTASLTRPATTLLGFGNFRTLEFYGAVFFLLFNYWFRLYAHYIGEYIMCLMLGTLGFTPSPSFTCILSSCCVCLAGWLFVCRRCCILLSQLTLSYTHRRSRVPVFVRDLHCVHRVHTRGFK